MLERDINAYFAFLEDYGFKRLPEYNYVREVHTDYIKDNLIVKIIFETSCIVQLIKLKAINKGLVNGSIKIVESRANDYKSKYLPAPKESTDLEHSLSYYANILKSKPELLRGKL